MKFGELKSIGHNIADSLASGKSLMITVYDMDVFGEAANSPEGYITIDFLNGTTTGAKPSTSLAEAVCQYSKALNGLCERHGGSIADFRELSAKYSAGGTFAVTVQDQNGQRSTDFYRGRGGNRVRILDEHGRVRPKKHKTSQQDG